MNARPPSALVPDATAPPAPDFAQQIGPLLHLAHRVALRRSGDCDLAEDLVQEAALRAFVHYGQFKPGTNFRAWFIRILLNCLRSHYRRAWRRRGAPPMHAPERRYGSAAAADCGPWSPTPDLADHVLSKLNAERISDVIGGLPDPYGVVCALYLLDDLSYAQIAHIVGCPLGTVRSRLHRARRMLRDRLCTMDQERPVAPMALACRDAPEPCEAGHRRRPSNCDRRLVCASTGAGRRWPAF
jgi:RNA polymerase sigma-70 factor (ECF subfamily)